MVDCACITLERSITRLFHSMTHSEESKQYEVLVNQVYSSNSQQSPNRWKKWLATLLAFVGTSSLVGYIFHRHYIHDLYAYIVRSRNQGLWTSTLQFLRILPKPSFFSIVEEYSYEMYCERLSHYLYESDSSILLLIR